MYSFLLQCVFSVMLDCNDMLHTKHRCTILGIYISLCNIYIRVYGESEREDKQMHIRAD